MSGRSARVLIVAGEASGDLYGSLVMRAMTGSAHHAGVGIAAPGGGEADAPGPRVRFVGVGGPVARDSLGAGGVGSGGSGAAWE